MENNDIVILELDRPRQLRLGHKVLKRYLAKTGLKMKQFDESVQDYENLCCLIYEMLHEEDPNLTPEACDDLLDMVPISEIYLKGAEAIKVGFGNQDETESEEKAENPTKDQ